MTNGTPRLKLCPKKRLNDEKVIASARSDVSAEKLPDSPPLQVSRLMHPGKMVITLKSTAARLLLVVVSGISGSADSAA